MPSAAETSQTAKTTALPDVPHQTISPEGEVAATGAVLSEGRVEVSEVMMDRQRETLALVKSLLVNVELSAKFSFPAGEEAQGEINVELTDVIRKFTPEALEACLKGLEADYKRGIVVVNSEKTVDDFKAALVKNRTAGISWDRIEEILLAIDSKLLKKAAQMQGKGQLIGVYSNGKLCIKDRGNEPVIFGQTSGGEQVTITTDTPNRADLMENISDSGQFADYWEIRAAVSKDSFTLPPDAIDCKKRGIVAAVEAITGNPLFVCSESGREGRSAILECGDVARFTHVHPLVHTRIRVVFFDPTCEDALIYDDNPEVRSGKRGAVRVLSG